MTKTQKSSLDRLWQKKILERDQKCRVCGSSNGVVGHHIFSRNNMNVRWDLDNGVLLCCKHHNLSNDWSAHSTYEVFFQWLEKTMGEKWIDDLYKKSLKVAKNLDYKKVKESLDEML